MKKHPSKQHRRKQKRPGSAPGTLEFTGQRLLEDPFVQCIRYNLAEIVAQPLENGGDFSTKPGMVTWYDVRGLHDVALVERFGQYFKIHPLALEDVLHTQQRPKFEEYGDEVFVVLQAFTFDTTDKNMVTEQISMYFGDGFLLTFQENADDTFAPVRDRLNASRGRIRSRGVDYLAYALIDNVVDNYFEVLDRVQEEMESIEYEITRNPTRQVKERVHHLKSQMLGLRKSVAPLREAVGKFSHCESKLVEDGTGLFVRDLHDHVIRIYDLIETYRDMLNGLQELYISELSLRMNNVMQVLTVITTIFVPLTFLAGVYGMNFDYMPELHWPNGYYYLLGVMGLVFLASMGYFLRKKWL